MLVRHAGIGITHQSSQHDAPLLLAGKRLDGQQSAQMANSLLLHSELDVNQSDSKGQTALWHAVNRCASAWSACRAGNFPAAKALLLNQKSPTGTTPLQLAVILNHLSIVSVLLREGICNLVNINATGPQQWTAIFFAASNGFVSVTKSLLKHPDIDLNLIDDQGRTPLWWAEHGQHSRVVDLLHRHSRSSRQKRHLARGVSK
ncbi:hypothetical protein N7466_001483 [Penicillium verhagenii]|uniref:uncharacterized protein n=1 Tax=Penicillium verhagenii TaxID=1562060 RepID=UPI002544D409|nr:uncharacterized protein N7466_001483 [Penicillium verhagenii]KAJ5938349.1 hypothetical protein N7466_001483 [Penicillium verhagenii]